uniref:Ribosomal protein L28 n=1 Tax=Arcella intermedia TaxID=1963864 RepID=A0A6B2LNG2_9EUKA
MRKTKRTWKPNVHWKTFYSDLLDKKFQVPVSTKALRCIDKAGGIDNYVLFTRKEILDSSIGEELKVHLIAAWEKKNGTKFRRGKILHQRKVELWQEEQKACEGWRNQWIQEQEEKAKEAKEKVASPEI